MLFAGFALLLKKMRCLLGFVIGYFLRLTTDYLIHPFSAHSKLILACVNGKTEALCAGLTPNASSTLAEAFLTAMPFSAGSWAMLNRPHTAIGLANPTATGILGPPLLPTPGAGLAANVVSAVRTLTGLADQV